MACNKNVENILICLIDTTMRKMLVVCVVDDLRLRPLLKQLGTCPIARVDQEFSLEQLTTVF